MRILRDGWTYLVDSLARNDCAAGCGAKVDGRAAAFCALCQDCVELARNGGALYEYGGPVSEAIRRLKYRGRWELGKSLGQRLGEYAAARREGAWDAVVPIPLQPRRRRLRGYNQAELLAAEVARALKVPMRRWLEAPDVPVMPQVARGRQSRRSGQVEFRCRRSVDDRRILLIDDVRTTGATLAAGRSALIQGGGASVDCLTLAVTVERL